MKEPNNETPEVNEMEELFAHYATPNGFECMKLPQALFGREHVSEATQFIYRKIREFMSYMKCDPVTAAEAIIRRGKLDGKIISFIILGTAHKMSYVAK